MEKILRHTANASLILFPVSIIGVKYFSGAVFLMVFFVGLIQSELSLKKVLTLSRNEKVLFFSVCFLSISTFLISFFNHTELGRARAFIALLMVIPIYMFFRKNLTTDKYLWIGLILGTVIGLVVSIYQFTGSTGSLNRASGATNPIIFGDLVLIMGVLSIAGYEYFWWDKKRNNPLFPNFQTFFL